MDAQAEITNADVWLCLGLEHLRLFAGEKRLKIGGGGWEGARYRMTFGRFRGD